MEWEKKKNRKGKSSEWSTFINLFRYLQICYKTPHHRLLSRVKKLSCLSHSWNCCVLNSGETFMLLGGRKWNTYSSWGLTNEVRSSQRESRDKNEQCIGFLYRQTYSALWIRSMPIMTQKSGFSYNTCTGLARILYEPIMYGLALVKDIFHFK